MSDPYGDPYQHPSFRRYAERFIRTPEQERRLREAEAQAERPIIEEFARVEDTWRDDGTVPAALEKLFYFRHSSPVNVIQISMVNSSRPEADARPCFAFYGPRGDSMGAASVLIAIGYTCSYGDHVQNFNKLLVRPDSQVGFKILGDNGDSVGAKVLYEEIE